MRESGTNIVCFRANATHDVIERKTRGFKIEDCARRGRFDELPAIIWLCAVPSAIHRHVIGCCSYATSILAFCNDKPDNNNHASITQRGNIAMDIWESGRQELAESLKGICDRIGANLVAGNKTNLLTMLMADNRTRTRPRKPRLYSP